MNLITKICKRRICNNSFIVSETKYKLFCSKICCDRQGKEDWKVRNKERYLKSERDRKRNKYKNDPIYSKRKKDKSNKNYHSLTPQQKFERNKKNRLKENPNKRRIYSRNYHKQRAKKDINFRLMATLRARVRGAIYNNGSIKSFKTIKLIGCDIQNLKRYLQSKFKPGMSWENYGKWHIDHIIPMSKFNLKSKSEQLICCNYKNLQPLWARENLSKGNKYE